MNNDLYDNIISRYKILDGDFISYNFLVKISKELNIDIKKLSIIFGIKNIRKCRIKLKVNLYDDEKKINIKILRSLMKIKILKNKNLENLSLKYRTNKRLICNYLKLSNSSCNRLLIKNMPINIRKTKFNIEDLLNNYLLEKKEITLKREINRFINYKYYIMYNDILNIKNIFKITEAEVIYYLNINDNQLEFIKGNPKAKIRIFNQEFFKISTEIIIYLLQESPTGKYHSKNEIIRLCKEHRIDYNIFLMYYSKNYKQYSHNKNSINKNLNGFWISNNSDCTKSFQKEIYELLRKKLINISRKITSIFKIRGKDEDYADDAIFYIYQRCLDIEKNFVYDKSLQLNILAKKAYYYIRRNIFNDLKYTKFNDNMI